MTKVCFAPFLGLTKPSLAARRMADAATRTFWAAFVLCALLYGAVWLWLVMLGNTVAYESRPSADGNEYTSVLVEKSVVDVWCKWHAETWLGYAELTIASAAFIFTAGVALLAWLHLPIVHGIGRIWPSYRRCLAAVMSAYALLLIFTLMVGLWFVFLMKESTRGNYQNDDQYFFIMLLSFASCCAMICWMGAAARSVAQRLGDEELPPRCEGCGYDLTGQPMDGRCPECGLRVDSSLSPDLCRLGVDWQHRQNPAGWLLTTLRTLKAPRRFYKSLRMRFPFVKALQYSRAHYPAVGACGGMLFLLCVTAEETALRKEALAVGAITGILIGLLAWAIHRLLGAVFASWLIVRGGLPDTRWIHHLICYEAAYLWFYFVVNAAFVISFFTFDLWISELAKLLGLWHYRGFPLEPLTVLAVNGLLTIGWLMRYNLAAKNVRWCNF